ncbi:Galactosyltransferase [Popillia japonica]|uniref:Hexosyltransferase n=1 Tax=Popillia japonica TaxID=7064 RepID=A0AAW1KM01_POPJA
MVAINLAPLNRTCKIENEDREYNIMNNSKLKNPDVIIVILSAPKNLNRRIAIRSTWLKLADNTQKHNSNIRIIKHYFVIGTLGLSNSQLAILKTEQIEYNDLLNLPIYDSYSNLTEKVIKSFSWLTDQLDVGLDFKFILKCDDDSFVRLDNFIRELSHLEIIYLKSYINDSYTIDHSSSYMTVNYQMNKFGPNISRGLYWGYFSGNARIKTKGKWKETEWILCDYYTPYALGGGYVLSKDLVIYLGRNADYLRYYNSEDISVGAWLSVVNNLVRIHDVRFDTQWIPRGCQNFFLISHNLSILKMEELYKNILHSGNLCKEEFLEYSHYLYNWSVPPSKCCSKIK